MAASSSDDEILAALGVASVGSARAKPAARTGKERASASRAERPARAVYIFEDGAAHGRKRSGKGTRRATARAPRPRISGGEQCAPRGSRPASAARRRCRAAAGAAHLGMQSPYPSIGALLFAAAPPPPRPRRHGHRRRRRRRRRCLLLRRRHRPRRHLHRARRRARRRARHRPRLARRPPRRAAARAAATMSAPPPPSPPPSEAAVSPSSTSALRGPSDDLSLAGLVVRLDYSSDKAKPWTNCGVTAQQRPPHRVHCQPEATRRVQPVGLVECGLVDPPRSIRYGFSRDGFTCNMVENEGCPAESCPDVGKCGSFCCRSTRGELWGSAAGRRASSARCSRWRRSARSMRTTPSTTSRPICMLTNKACLRASRPSSTPRGPARSSASTRPLRASFVRAYPRAQPTAALAYNPNGRARGRLSRIPPHRR